MRLSAERFSAESTIPPPQATTLAPRRQSPELGGFQLPKRRLADLLEDLAARCGRPRLDNLVEVDAGPAELLADQTGDGGLARAHEAYEEDVAHRAIRAR